MWCTYVGTYHIAKHLVSIHNNMFGTYNIRFILIHTTIFLELVIILRTNSRICVIVLTMRLDFALKQRLLRPKEHVVAPFGSKARKFI